MTIFYSDNTNFASAKLKFRRKHKYAKKLLVWIAISPRRISEPFIVASGIAVDQFVCNYAEHSLDFLCENLIHHVEKVDNAANLPKVRPIEDFWSILKAKVYENNCEAKSLHEL